MAAVLTGVDPGSSSLRLVQGTLNGPLFKLTRLVEIPIDAEGDAEVAVLEAVRELGESKLKSGSVRLGVTGRDLMIRYTTVPPVPLWRLKMLMDFEVHDMAQSSGDPLTADYNILTGREDADDETVLVSLVKSFFLGRRFAAANQAGLDVRAATPNCVALFNAFLGFGEMEDDEYTFLLDVGHHNVEMAIQKDGELLFARNLFGGGEAFTKAIAESFDVGMPKARDLKHQYGNVAPRNRASFSSSQEEKVANSIIGVAGQLAGMVQSTINFCRAQSGVKDLSVGRVMLSGGGANLKGLDVYLEDNLRVPVKRFEPDAGLDISGLDGEELAAFDEDRGAWVCALGLARMNDDADAFLIDIVPDDVKKKRKFKARTLWMVLAGVAASLFLLFSWTNLSSQAKEIAAVKDEAAKKQRREARKRKNYEDMVVEAEDVRGRVNRLSWESRGATYLLRAQRLLQANAPEAVWLRRVEVAVKSVPRPGDDRKDRKNRVEKTVVSVDGVVRQLGERVTTTFNKFVQSIRDDELKPVVEIERRPQESDGEFRFVIDFAGWGEDLTQGDDEEDDS